MTTPYFPINELHLLCVPSETGWLIQARPGALPDYLRPFFDGGEAFPIANIDLTDLARFMAQRSAEYACVPTRAGSLQISASGGAVAPLGKWIAGAISSGVR